VILNVLLIVIPPTLTAAFPVWQQKIVLGPSSFLTSFRT
jgi:hypothetical protein